MASDGVYVSSQTTGVLVACESIGSKEYQQVKLIDGAASQTTPIAATSGAPAASSVGLIVAVKPGVSVQAQVSGAVAISTMPAVSGTVTVNGSVALAGTGVVSVVPGVSVTI